MDNSANAALASSNLNAIALLDNFKTQSAQQANPAVAGEGEYVARPPEETFDTAEFSAEALTLSQEEGVRSMEDFRPVEQSRLEEQDNLETITDRFIQDGGWRLAEIDPETAEEVIVANSRDTLETESNTPFSESTNQVSAEEAAAIASQQAQTETEAEAIPTVEGTGATAAASTTTTGASAATVNTPDTGTEVFPTEPFPTAQEVETIETGIADDAEEETLETNVTAFTTAPTAPTAPTATTAQPLASSDTVETTEDVEPVGIAVNTEEEIPNPEAQVNQAGLNAVFNNANGLTPEATAAAGAENVSESVRSEEQILLQNVGTQLAQIVPPPSVVSVLV